MSLHKLLETIGAILHPERERPPDATEPRRGNRRDKSPLPEAGTVKRWQPPTEGTTPARRKRRRPRRVLRAMALMYA